MDFNRFTEKLQEAVRAAQARRYGTATNRSTWSTCCRRCWSRRADWPTSILTRAGVNVEALRAKLTSELERLPKVSGSASGVDQIYVTPRLNKLLTAAEDEAAKLKDEYVSVEHVLLAAVDSKDLGVTRERLMQALREVRGNQRVTSQNPEVDLRGAGAVRPRPDEAGRRRASWIR